MAELRINISEIVDRVIEQLKSDGLTIAKHAKWITTQKAIDDGFTTCSYCHREFYIDDLAHVGNEDGFCEFCPNCGAKMDGDSDETT